MSKAVPLASLAVTAVAAALAIASGDPDRRPALAESEVFTLSVPGVVEGRFPVRAASFTPEVGASTRGFCPEEPRLANFVDPSSYVVVPGFVQSEEAAAILRAPEHHYPIEILKIGIGWASQFGGNDVSLEDSINIYPGAVTSSGFLAPQFIAESPALADGAINEFDITTPDSLPGGSRIITDGPFTVSIKIFNPSQGRPNAPAPIHDNRGCIAARSAVRIAPLYLWLDNCSLGVSGQWVIYAKYRRVECGEDPPCAADVTGDGLVNSVDLAQVLASWGPGGAADVTGDGIVNAADLAIVLGAWGPCLP